MKYSRIITLLLLLILFSFISEMEGKLKEQVSQWTHRYTEQLELGFRFSPFDLNSDSLFFKTLK